MYQLTSSLRFGIEKMGAVFSELGLQCFCIIQHFSMACFDKRKDIKG